MIAFALGTCTKKDVALDYRIIFNPDFRCTEAVKYNYFVLPMRGHLSYDATFFIAKGIQMDLLSSP